MPHVSQENVRYLAFEGGGGKGVAYLGAIKALEERWRVERVKDRLKGISGASAGAITALFLAMGLSSKQLAGVIAEKAALEGFFDEPRRGYQRVVTRHNLPDLATDAPEGTSYHDVQRMLEERAKKTNLESALLKEFSKWGTMLYGSPGLCAGLGIAGLVVLFAQLKKKGLLESVEKETPELAPFLRPIAAHTEDFLYNLVWDRGLYLGLAVRRYFWKKMASYLSRELSNTGLIAGRLNFREFHEITQIDLVISGCNITKGRPFLFSSKLTPHFPVAEAVAISMNLPLIFKPIRVEEPDPKSVDPNGLGGLWVDGGLLNNLPIHAFDTQGGIKADPDLRALNPNVLALRLTPSSGEGGSDGEEGMFDTLRNYLGGVLGTVLYPSSEGQLRTPSEEEQTIKLSTGKLSLLEFAPDPRKTDAVVANAYQMLNNYFAFGVSGRR